MKTDTLLWAIVAVAFVGVIWFGMKPKVCIDNQTGDPRMTHRLFPCKANETGVTA